MRAAATSHENGVSGAARGLQAIFRRHEHGMDPGRNLDELPRAFNPPIPVERCIHEKINPLPPARCADPVARRRLAGSRAIRTHPQEQMACRSDAGKFCAEHIGKPPQMNACLRANKEKLSDGCRKVVESHGG
jgi:hypothetical protein